MKNLLRFILICIPLAGCVQDDVKPIEAKIDYPPLAHQDDVDALQLETVAELTDVDEARVMLIDVLARLMNVVEITNQMADEVAEGTAPDPLLKPSAREFKIIDARTDLCANSDGQNSQTESLVQNDADNDNGPSLGDEWSYIWEGCENTSNNSTVTGVMSFTGMADPLDELNSSIDIETFSGYKYSFDMQIDSLNNKSVFLQQTKFIFSRDEDEVTTLEISPDSIMGVISDDDLYVFKINEASLVSNDDDSTLELSLDARYYYSEADEKGYVDLVTSENLLFEYDLALTNPQSTTLLLSGGLDMIGNDDVKASLSVDEDETKLKVLLSGADGSSETVDQASFFNTGEFSLVNLTGLSN